MTLTRDRKTELLAAAPLLAGVDAAGLERIADRTVEVVFTDGHVIARQGEVGTGFFLIASGGARVVRDGQTIATLGPGDFFGELSVLDGLPRIAQVLADGRDHVPRARHLGARGGHQRAAIRGPRAAARPGRASSDADRSRPALTDPRDARDRHPRLV